MLLKKSKKILLLIFFSLLTAVYAYGTTTAFFIKGKLSDHQWAYSSNRLALLILPNESTNHSIHILDADKKKFTAKIELQKHMEPNCLAWSRDEKGFYLSTFNHSDHRSEIYKFNTIQGTYDQMYKNSEIAYGIHKIAIDPKSDYWAYLYAEEGHPGINVYIKERYIFSPCVGHENSISIVAWEKGKLICQSDMMLDDKLGCGETAQKEAYNGSRYTPGLIYEIDPFSRKAKKTSIAPKTLTNRSFDGRYQLTIDELDNTIKICLNKIK